MDASTTRSRKRTTAIGWILDPAQRPALLERYPPAYPDVVAHHITLKMHSGPRAPLPEPCTARIVGEADDGAGVQCLVVEVDGSVDRPDGGVFHVTWSLDRARGRRPVDSNGVIAWLGWRPSDPVDLTVTPGRF